MTANLVTQLGRRAATIESERRVEGAHAGRPRPSASRSSAGSTSPSRTPASARGGSVLDMDLKDWQDQLDINLTGVFLTVQAAAQRMVQARQRRTHRVHLVARRRQHERRRCVGYSATKAGVRIMVRGWAQDLGPYGITVNAIGPGVIDTPLAAGLAGDRRRCHPQRARVSARRSAASASPADIAGLINFMAGPDGDFMTGSYVIMDGGIRDARAAASMPIRTRYEERDRTPHQTATADRHVSGFPEARSGLESTRVTKSPFVRTLAPRRIVRRASHPVAAERTYPRREIA